MSRTERSHGNEMDGRNEVRVRGQSGWDGCSTGVAGASTGTLNLC